MKHKVDLHLYLVQNDYPVSQVFLKGIETDLDLNELLQAILLRIRDPDDGIIRKTYIP